MVTNIGGKNIGGKNFGGEFGESPKNFTNFQLPENCIWLYIYLCVLVLVGLLGLPLYLMISHMMKYMASCFNFPQFFDYYIGLRVYQ